MGHRMVGIATVAVDALNTIRSRFPAPTTSFHQPNLCAQRVVIRPH